ncbi:cytochrome c biogenesis protein ResB [Roseateles sp. So40a]|uniref:cytochrome c biogenesis protein ResB n=1 Tax=Roseateles sp. So40a TaxID=3400226 RepID=UPI003A842B1E
MTEKSPDRPPRPAAAATLRVAFDDALELLASMRFAIALLTVLCIASVIGTVVQQRQPMTNYVNQFGPFWSELFGKVDLYTVYSAWWFLLMLGFLVVSTSLCIARHTPKILRDLKTFKESMREQAIQAFKLKALGYLHMNPEAALGQVNAWLAAEGWKARAQVRHGGVMIGARKGSAHKIGYLAAHSAIVLICLGGLFDGDLVVRAVMWAQGKQIYQGADLNQIAPVNRLSPGNPSFRGNLYVPEGSRSSTALISMPSGVVVQDLPFDVELKKFIVEYYSTGMPKLFASDIVLHDRQDGSTHTAKIEVNKPFTYRGVTMYQSSFEDGGSGLKLRLRALQSAHDTPLDGRVNGTTTLTVDGESYGLEFTGLRVINVENFADDGKDKSGADVRKVDLVGRLEQHLGSGANVSDKKTLRNVGPSFSYKLRDASGQAREYNNYMFPLELEGHRVYLLGVRDTLADSFRYLRVPVDSKDSLEGWLALRRVLADPAQRLLAARHYALGASPTDKPAMQAQLEATALRTLTLFAGAEGLKADTPAQGAALGGLPALSQFIEREVPEPERGRVSEVLLRILNGSLFELHKQAEEQLGRPRPEPGDATQAFMTQAVLSLSDAMFYPAPVVMQLDDYQQVQASVFQVTRAPGQTLVYLGAVLLIVGVFAMLYVKDRRLWLWLEAAPGRPEQTRVRMALSSNRETAELPVEFESLKQRLLHEEA